MPYATGARLLIKLAAYQLAELATYYAASQIKEPANDFEARKLHLVFERVSGPTGSEIAEDVAVMTFHLVNITDGEPDKTWTDADFVTCENAFLTWWGTQKAQHWSGTKLKEFRWYRHRPGVIENGPAVRVVPVAIAGTGTAALPPQVAVSLTERTALRKHWGRSYLPSLSQATCATEGYVKSANHLLIADAVGTLYNTLTQADFLPVVYSPTKRMYFSVEKVVVDDLFDVIRSRRYDRPKVRHIRPA